MIIETYQTILLHNLRLKFFSSAVASAGASFSIKQNVTHNGIGVNLNQGTKRDLASTYNDNDRITFGYEGGRHFVEFKEINEVPFTVDLTLTQAKTAASIARGKILGIITKVEVNILEAGKTSRFGKNYSSTIINYRVRYFQGSNVIQTLNNYFDIRYNTGEIDSRYNLLKPNELLHLGSNGSGSEIVVVPINESADRVVVDFGIDNTHYQRQIIGEASSNTFVNTDIDGFANDDYVKCFIDNIVIKGYTGSYNRLLDEKKTTLLEFVEKAIFDYNFNSRQKVTLNDDVRVLLDVVAKESEWGDYTLRELLERAFKYVGLVPILNPDYSISYTKTNKGVKVYKLANGK